MASYSGWWVSAPPEGREPSIGGSSKDTKKCPPLLLGKAHAVADVGPEEYVGRLGMAKLFKGIRNWGRGAKRKSCAVLARKRARNSIGK